MVGIAEIKEGSQIAASNFYMDIEEARALATLPAGLVNQVFLKVADMAETERVKQSIAAWLPRASIASPGTMLQLFGGVSQTIGRFGPLAVAVGAAAALALSAMLVLGVIAERRRELAVLRVLGWHSAQVRRQLAVEMAVQGLLGGLLALALVALGVALMSRVAISLPASSVRRKSRQFRAWRIQGRQQRHQSAGRDHAVGLARTGRDRNARGRTMGMAVVGGEWAAEPVGSDKGLILRCG